MGANDKTSNKLDDYMAGKANERGSGRRRATKTQRTKKSSTRRSRA